MFLSCGDALIDFFQSPVVAAKRVSGAVELSGHVGGSPLNVAIGLARLGFPTAYLTKNSRDVFGHTIAAYLTVNNVSTSFLVETDLNTTLAIVATRADGSVDYAFYTNGTADRSLYVDELPAMLDPSIACIHVASYSTVCEPTASSLLALVTREAGSRLISYDPNIRPSIEPDLDVWRDRLAAFGACAHLVKASDQDVETLYPGQSFDAFAAERIAAGAQLVFITRGAKGAVGYSADGRRAEVDGVAVKVVDTVGAGDTFQAACLTYLADHGLLRADRAAGTDLEDLMGFAVNAAAITCSRRGADLPSRADLVAQAPVHRQDDR